MQQRTMWVAMCALVLGCGGTASEITIGSSAVIDFDARTPGQTVLRLKMGSAECHPTKVSVIVGHGPPTVVASRATSCPVARS